MGEILNGTSERLVIENDTMATYNYFQTYDGLVKYIEMQQVDEASASAKNGVMASSPVAFAPNVMATGSTVRRFIFLWTEKI